MVMDMILQIYTKTDAMPETDTWPERNFKMIFTSF